LTVCRAKCPGAADAKAGIFTRNDCPPRAKFCRGAFSFNMPTPASSPTSGAGFLRIHAQEPATALLATNAEPARAMPDSDFTDQLAEAAYSGVAK